MIIKRVEISLYGPDEFPAEEGSELAWTKQELVAGVTLHHALVLLSDICKKKLPEGFEIDISPPLDESGEVNVRALH